MKATRVLTGITTSGTPHLGNYVGAIRPAIAASRAAGVESFYFLADYHALIKVDDPARIQRSTLEIAATWIACGLDPERVTFYRQSDIPEIPELTWFLTCVCGKGLLNRAHAYKAAVDKNTEAQQDPDADVTAGLFMYPVLMAADILMFNAHQVPVGRDQIQHIEMARDLASSFNHRYGEHFVLPEALIEDHVATLPGLDGRKMSKSYDNTIPLFAPPEQMQKIIAGIKTDSLAPGEPKTTDGSALFQIYQAFGSVAECDAMRQAYAQGIAWADAKHQLFERINQEISPLRARYEELMAHPEQLEALLQAGAAKARSMATPMMSRARHAVGLRNLLDLRNSKVSHNAKAHKTALPSFKQYRDADGKFYFKLVDAAGKLLLQSQGYASPQDAGIDVKKLQADPKELANMMANLKLNVATDSQLEEALNALQQLKDTAA
jgi:tryptophanyl-tRNA synthetase